MKPKVGQIYTRHPVYEDEKGCYCKIYDINNNAYVGDIRPHEFNPPLLKSISKKVLLKETIHETGRRGNKTVYYESTWMWKIVEDDKRNKYIFLTQTRDGELQITTIEGGSTQSVDANPNGDIYIIERGEESVYKGQIARNAEIYEFDEGTGLWQREVNPNTRFGD